MASATYTKLKDGSWGVRVPGQVKAGQSIIVTKKSGESKSETVDRVLWNGDGVSLCSVKQQTAAASVSSGRGRGQNTNRRYECQECGELVYPGTSCWETGMAH